MSTRRSLALGAALLAFVQAAPGAPPEAEGRGPDAAEIIRNHLAATGAEKIRNAETLVYRGGVGSSLLLTTRDVTLYLRKPDRMKKQEAFRITLRDGDRYLFNDGRERIELAGGIAERLRFQTRLYLGGISLLGWSDHFGTAELAGRKSYGGVEQYALRFPDAEDGRGLLAYVDGSTWLLDRLVYPVEQEGAGNVDMVILLRDYRLFGGVRMPGRVVFEKIGWEESPNHFLISSVLVDPPLAEGLFENADIDFGEVRCGEGTVEGEIRGSMDGFVLTNLTLDHLEEAGIEDLAWLDLEAGSTRARVRFLENIHASAEYIVPEGTYLCMYSLCGFPRLLLLAWNADAAERVPCAEGDRLVVRRAADEGAGGDRPGGGES